VMNSEQSSWTIRQEGDSGIVVSFPEFIDPIINSRCVTLACEIRSRQLPWVRDVVEGYASVTVYFDLLAIDNELAVGVIRNLASKTVAGPEKHKELEPIRLPVCYGGRYGPDLSVVSAYAQCSEHDVIRRHASVTYRVYMLGFLPGFAYLGKVDQKIAAPRRKSPRLVVHAGSVGIAGKQTGVYPSQSPGGWQIIGRCPVKLLNWSIERPFLLESGKSVRFEPIGEQDYERIQENTL